ncbi:serine/threonine-protein kinase, putative [Trypanosoma equiperdum]|uniref:non-specific serine/threonine protein kinase n=2 Tax=Trypanozoon TaxID=39700 RepID=Q580F5_TRYB2|nr:serine/threonine-protein kinase, putative [Trypanosoma brucei brucei TREU927]AAX79774.1 serine/threonine-protein kinase, putative [Trypanosoma brucei]AAZ12936.1 serine/threonine-protein kinase, putative [Trypanosoma brucei brucei TREU927]SCU67453.1 serine/threonine-protein kinase, putative [Trypanosoma equiperdum]
MNEYHIIEKMAVGSFGVVFKVRRAIDDGVFVMKRINLAEFQDQQRLDAVREIEVMSLLNHPFIVAQRDAFLFNKENLCIVMDYYDGGDLDRLVAQQREKDEYLPLESVMKWFASVCFAMQYLHAQGIVHRDLKTSNIFLDLQSQEVAVGDFGVAEVMRTPATDKLAWKVGEHRGGKVSGQNAWEEEQKSSEDGGCTVRSSPTTRASPGLEGNVSLGEDGLGVFNGAMRGTPLYMSPENLERGVCSPSSDVWSLGCILYELLSLRHPFESRDITTLMMRVITGARQPLPSHYPPEVAELVDRMLALDPQQRPSCDDILRCPIMSGAVHAVVSQHVSHDTPDSVGEHIFLAQQRELGVVDNTGKLSFVSLPREGHPALPPSQERVQAEARATASLGRLTPPRFFPATPTATCESTAAMPPRAFSCNGGSNVSFGMDFERADEGRRGARSVSNVEDMRHKPIAQIEEEVAWYRQLVQNEMRALKQRRDAAVQRRRLGTNGSTLNGGSVNENKHHTEGDGRTSSWLPALPTQHTVERRSPRQLSQMHSKYPSPRHSEANNCNLNRTPSVGGGEDTSSARPPGGLEASLLARRQLRWDVAVKALGLEVTHNVYNYYRCVDVAERDAVLVMQMVPDRAQWHVLPDVEEVVVIDRLLEGTAVAGPA